MAISSLFDMPKNLVKAPVSMVVTLLFVMLVSLGLAIVTYDKGLQKIPVQSILIYEASEVGLPRSTFAADTITSRRLQRKLPSPLTSQYHMDLKSGEIPESVVVLGLGGPSRLYLNGIGLKSSTPQPYSGPVQGAFWLMSELPPALLNQGENRLDIVMVPSLWRTGISQVLLGSKAQTEALASSHLGLQSNLHGLSLIAGLLCLICVPITFFVERARAISFGASVIAASLIIGHFSSDGRLTTPMFLLPHVWSDGVMVMASLALLIGSQKLPGWYGGVFRGLSVALLLSAVLALSDLSLNVDVAWQLVFSQIAPLALAGIGMPVLMAISLKSLVDERAQSRAEALRQAALVAEQAKLIEEQAEYQAVIEERKRFTRDIHDGIGGQLVSLLWRVRSETVPAEELAYEIESGLADLRLVADALDEGTVSLPIALWNFSTRARQQLDAAQITFEWSLPNEINVDWSDARRILSLYRMLQECVSNVVRHAGASHLRIEFKHVFVDEIKCLHVTVADNGRGFETNAQRGGRGLTNLKTRAAQLGGRISFVSGPNDNGTMIEITLPCSQDAQIPG
jgi:signal transduction histidine kinase